MAKTKCQKNSCARKVCSKNKCAQTKNKCVNSNAAVTLKSAVSSTAAHVTLPLESGLSLNGKSATAPKVVTESAAFTAERIQKSAETFYTLYARYESVRELAKRLNGLPQSSALPDGVVFNKIEFDFAIDGKQYVVNMADIKALVEITPIISNTLSTFLEKMYQEIFSLNNTGTAMQRAIEQAIVKPVTPNTQILANAEKS